MSTNPPSLAGLIRHWLGTDRIPNLEAAMATVNDALNALVAQQQEASAAQLVAFSNLQAAIDRLQREVQAGNLSEEAAAAVQQLSAGFTEMTAAANRADDGFEPATSTETTPDGTAPVEATVPDAGEPVDTSAAEGDASQR